MQIKLKNSEVGIFSDPHYGVHRNSEVWHKIALDHAKWTAQQFKERGIQDIIIPGDIFHDRNDIAVNTLHVATDTFDIFMFNGTFFFKLKIFFWGEIIIVR